MGAKSVVVEGPGSWAIAETEVGVPLRDEVVLEMSSAGICGGDRALLAGENAVARYPLVLGHECVARVVDPGDSTLRSGDYVVVYPTIPCGECAACRAGRGNQCAGMVVMGLSHPRGCFSDRFLVQEEQCIPVPVELADRYGALIEPVAVGCHITTRAGLHPDDTVLVIGAGAIGLATAVVSQALGARRVGCVDRYPNRSGVAEALGIDVFTTAEGAALGAWIEGELGTPDVVIDSAVTEETADIALEHLRPGGRYAPVASSKAGQKLPVRYDRFFLKELTMVTARNYVPSDFIDAISLLTENRPDLTALVTGRFPLQRFGEAIEQLTTHPEQHVKILLHPGEAV